MSDAVRNGRGTRAVDPDAELVARIARGDQRAAATLVERHLGRMTALARRMLGDQSEAEDVAQEVFLRVWRNAANWEPGKAKFATWMHRVAINLCYDRLRRGREIPTDAPPEQIDDAPSAYELVNAGDLARRVEQAVAALPPRQRAAVTLCHYQELSNIEAAEILEVSVEAVESLLSRGRRALRTALRHEAQGLLDASEGRRGG